MKIVQKAIILFAIIGALLVVAITSIPLAASIAVLCGVAYLVYKRQLQPILITLLILVALTPLGVWLFRKQVAAIQYSSNTPKLSGIFEFEGETRLKLITIELDSKNGKLAYAPSDLPISPSKLEEVHVVPKIGVLGKASSKQIPVPKSQLVGLSTLPFRIEGVPGESKFRIVFDESSSAKLADICCPIVINGEVTDFGLILSTGENLIRLKKIGSFAQDLSQLDKSSQSTESLIAALSAVGALAVFLPLGLAYRQYSVELSKGRSEEIDRFVNLYFKMWDYAYDRERMDRILKDANSNRDWISKYCGVNYEGDDLEKYVINSIDYELLGAMAMLPSHTDTGKEIQSWVISYVLYKATEEHFRVVHRTYAHYYPKLSIYVEATLHLCQTIESRLPTVTPKGNTTDAAMVLVQHQMKAIVDLNVGTVLSKYKASLSNKKELAWFDEYVDVVSDLISHMPTTVIFDILDASKTLQGPSSNMLMEFLKVESISKKANHQIFERLLQQTWRSG